MACETAFARTKAAPALSRPLLMNRPFTLLAAATSATSPSQRQEVRHVDVLSGFKRNVIRPLGDLIDARFVYPPLTPGQFRDVVGEGSWNFTVLCGPIGGNPPAPVLWFDGSAGKGEPVSWSEVAHTVCKDSPPALLVVLAHPYQGDRSPAQASPNLAGEFLAAGVRAIVEFFGPVDGDHFRVFGEAFFSRFLQTGSVDEAVAAGRRRLWSEKPEPWIWTYPVLTLYSSSDSQQFFLLPSDLERDLSELGASRSLSR
jgi:hypothetical protein